MKIQNGRIYKFHGVAVRSIMKTQNGLRIVQTAEKLNGFAHEHELEWASGEEVKKYVDKVRSLA